MLLKVPLTVLFIQPCVIHKDFTLSFDALFNSKECEGIDSEILADYRSVTDV